MNQILFEIQTMIPRDYESDDKSKRVFWFFSEAVIININLFTGFIPLRSIHDSAFFRKLADARSESQELMAKWCCNSLATINVLEGITTCHMCLANVTCDLVGNLHEHNCALVRQTLHDQSQEFTRLFNSARETTDARSVERADQQRQILFCPTCQKCHYCPALSVLIQFDVHAGFYNDHTYESAKLKRAIQDIDAPDYC